MFRLCKKQQPKDKTSKIKLELSKVTSDDYKGRTEYWKMANDILED